MRQGIMQNKKRVSLIARDQWDCSQIIINYKENNEGLFIHVTSGFALKRFTPATHMINISYVNTCKKTYVTKRWRFLSSINVRNETFVV